MIELTRFLPRLRLFVVAAILVAATAGNVFSQTPPAPDARAHSGYAYALMRRGKLSDAIQHARRSLAIDPKNIDALYTMGVINLRGGNKEEALKNAEALIALQPDLAEAYLIKSQAFVSVNGEAIMRPSSEEKSERISRYKSAAEASSST